MLARLIYRVAARIWRLGDVLAWLAGLPVLGPLLGKLFFSPRDNQAILIPVNEAIRGGESVVLPYALLSDLLARASHRVVLNECLCRRGEGCHAYPIDLGCLFLGGRAALKKTTLGRAVSVAEGQAHIERALAAGLLPTIVHASLDAFVLQLPFRKMLTVCFCCDCCCTIRKGLRMAPEVVGNTVTRLPGLTVSAGDACVGCGTCIDACPVGAIALVDGRAVIGAACKGCGRCAALCPTGAITLDLDAEADPRAQLWSLVEARTDIGQRQPDQQSARH